MISVSLGYTNIPREGNWYSGTSIFYASIYFLSLRRVVTTVLESGVWPALGLISVTKYPYGAIWPMVALPFWLPHVFLSQVPQCLKFSLLKIMEFF